MVQLGGQGQGLVAFGKFAEAKKPYTDYSPERRNYESYEVSYDAQMRREIWYCNT
jgi:hypothetical protein